jgi:hypothetical protein
MAPKEWTCWKIWGIALLLFVWRLARFNERILCSEVFGWLYRLLLIALVAYTCSLVWDSFIRHAMADL